MPRKNKHNNKKARFFVPNVVEPPIRYVMCVPNQKSQYYHKDLKDFMTNDLTADDFARLERLDYREVTEAELALIMSL